MDAMVEEAMVLLGISQEQLYRRGIYANVDPGPGIALEFARRAAQFHPGRPTADAEQWRLLDRAKNTLLDYCSQQSAERSPANKRSRCSDPIVITTEPIDTANIHELCKFRATALAREELGNRSIRDVLANYALRAKACGGKIVSAWGECKEAARVGIRTRLVTCSKDDIARDEPILEDVRDATGLSGHELVRSVFELPKSIRHVLRAGSRGADVDLTNSHFRATLTRHPELVHVRRYLSETDRYRSAVHPDATVAKKFFVAVLNGASVANWCSANGAPEPPDFVLDLARELATTRQAETLSHPDLAAKLRNSERSLLYWLNCITERRELDGVEALLAEHGMKVCAYEGDGLWCVPTHHTYDGWKEVLDGFNAKIKPVPSLQEALAVARAKFPGDWETVDECWLEEFEALQEFRRYLAANNSQCHMIAQRVLSTGFYKTDYVRDMFRKTFDASRNEIIIAHYCRESGHWSLNDERSKELLLHIAFELLGRAKHGGLLPRCVTNKAFLCTTVEAYKIEMPYDEHFAARLDAESTWRYVQFEGSVFDRESCQFVAPRPELMISLSTGYPFLHFDAPVKERFVVALRRVLEDWDFEERLDCPDAAALREELEDIARHLPALGTIYKISGGWSESMWLIAMFSSAFLGCAFEHFLVFAGRGKNGKDTLVKMLLPTFGEYARACDDSVLKKPFDHSVPEPVLAGLRGRRLAYNTEVAKAGKLCANNLKKLADMRGATLNPRFLHQNNPPAWRPSALLVIAFNGTRDFDEYDHGLLRRCHVANFPFAFVQEPQTDTERAVDPRLKTHEFGESLRAELVWLFFSVHSEWLRSCTDTVIRPVPSSVSEATKELLCKVVEEENALGVWVGENFEATPDYAHASSARIVKQMVADFLGVKSGEANQALEALGYRDVRTKAGYRYRGSKGWLQRRGAVA